MLAVESRGKMDKKYHFPVMSKEIIDGLEIAKRKHIIDCTAGTGGHAHKMLSAASDAFYVGIDKDESSLRETYKRLSFFSGRFVLLQDDFRNLDLVCQEMRINKADAFIFDLGMSSYQLSCPKRGFAFSKEGCLDMRFDESSFVTAADLINNLSERELVDVFRSFGQERYARRIAHAVVYRRKGTPILTTSQLARIVEKSVPPKSRFGRIHPATRVFQALRIAVNRELEALEAALPKAVDLLAKGGRIGVMSFHSLEDRIVKHTFKKLALENKLKIITKKPQVPTEDEKQINPASRSAKLRIGEKI